MKNLSVCTLTLITSYSELHYLTHVSAARIVQYPIVHLGEAGPERCRYHFVKQHAILLLLPDYVPAILLNILSRR